MSEKIQHELTSQHDLLDSYGHLTEAGYAKSLILNYNRSAIKAPGFKIKEWDYYLIACDEISFFITPFALLRPARMSFSSVFFSSSSLLKFSTDT